jgi:hypothetical protein
MKRVVTEPQKSDMGDGFGHIEGAVGYTLEEVLNFYSKNSKTWGTVCIYRKGNIVRKFDYDTYNNNVFYHYLSGWEYKLIVKEAKFNYCFMCENLDIYLE